MKTWLPSFCLPCLLILLGLFAMTGPCSAQLFKKPSGLIREKGALYLEDATEREMRAITTAESPVFSDLKGQRRLGVIPANRSVTVVAITRTAMRVRGRALHDNVVGWIARSSATPLDEKLVSQIRAASERRQAVDALIFKKEIAIGMTTSEVEAALGQPSERNSRVDAQGRLDSLAYVTYRTITRQLVQYDQFGRAYSTFVPQKVETGRRSVEFLNGIVSAYTESERLRQRRSGITVPPPVILEGGW